MTNFVVNFTHPWLLLVLIPAIIAAFIPYLRLNKKYRRSRNRVTSLVLHIVVLVLSILTLSGLNFTYDIPKDGNQMILLVDMSDTEETFNYNAVSETPSREVRDEFVRSALEMCEKNGMSVGVVTFGFDQVYAVPFTKNAKDAFKAYTEAPLPDKSGTDIAAAINYARTLFTNPDTAKIIVASDGKETDGDVIDAITMTLKQNTKIDYVNIETYFNEKEIQVTDVIFPDYHVKKDEACTVKVVLQSNSDNVDCTVIVKDNGETVAMKSGVGVYAGANEVTFDDYKFTTEGVHSVVVTVQPGSGTDKLDQNNEYTSYFNILNFNKILVLEGVSNQSDNLKDLLIENDLYDVTVENLYTGNVPSSVDELREYDEIILNNVANKDLDSSVNFNVAENFVKMLGEYVEVYGGGLLTVGGSEADDPATAHAYNRDDMNNTLYQSMLPVQAINYTPPLGVVVIIDISGSMDIKVDEGYSRLHWAKEGANTCLRALSERDYIGIMTLMSSNGITFENILPMTSRTREATIREAIYSIPDKAYGGGTVFSGAIEEAGSHLRSLTQVEKRHIIIVTDGEPGEPAETYESVTRNLYYQYGITMSVVALGVNEGTNTGVRMESLVAQCTDDNGVNHGKVYYVPNNNTSVIGDVMKDDLNQSELEEVNYETYQPIVSRLTSPLVVDLERDENNSTKLNTTLDGFYGVKVRPDAELILTGNFNVPLYAQWKYGNGMVGSFMCDLNKVWSAQFMESNVGATFIRNVCEALMPVSSIRPVELNVRYEEKNFTNTLDVFDQLGEGEKIIGKVRRADDDGFEVSLSATGDLSQSTKAAQTEAVFVREYFTAENNYSNCKFVIKEAGVYVISLERVNADGERLAYYEFYKSFAYSDEYDVFFDENKIEGKTNIEKMAKTSGGTIIADPYVPNEIFNDFVLKVNSGFDPRYLFMIIAIVAFLLDIIVRKFKFKWPHEWFKKREENTPKK